MPATTKKRELLQHLNSAIVKLTELAPDLARLEYLDNDQASRRIKRGLRNFKNKELKEFQDAIYSIREEFKLKAKTKKYSKAKMLPVDNEANGPVDSLLPEIMTTIPKGELPTPDNAVAPTFKDEFTENQ